MSNINFFKQWAQYRKQGHLQNPYLVLGHRPNNMQELSFALQVVTSLSLLHSLPLQSLPSPFHSTLLSNVEDTLVKSKISQNYVQSLISMHLQFNHETKKDSHLQRVRTILIEVLEKLIAKSKTAAESGRSKQSRYLLFLGACFSLQSKSKVIADSLQIIRGWWSCKRWLGDYVNRETFELLMLWGYFEHKSDMEWLQDSTVIMQKQLDYWFQQLQLVLSRQAKITENILISIEKEGRQLCRLWQLKGAKASQNHLKQIKQQILKRYSTYNKPQFFPTIFSSLQFIALEAEISLFTYADILENEQLFYGTLLNLQRDDSLQLFPKFHSFMRDQSTYSVLKISLTITPEMQTVAKYNNDIKTALLNKDLKVITEFLIRPVQISKIVLQFYLQISGVKIAETKKKAKRANISHYMAVSDPLLFTLILKKCWEDKFGYEILGISLWITLQAYCKQLAQRKDIPQKDLFEYIKKLKLSLCLYLLGLKFPVKMLQYLPEECELINQFILVPVLPAVLLQTGYFFKQFNRDSLEISSKTEIAVQSDSLPWVGKVLLSNNIPTLLHGYKGYEFCAQSLSFIATSNRKNYAQVILKSMNSVLLGLGILQTQNQLERKQCLSMINTQKIQQMRNLLAKISKIDDKTGISALQLLKFLRQTQ